MSRRNECYVCGDGEIVISATKRCIRCSDEIHTTVLTNKQIELVKERTKLIIRSILDVHTMVHQEITAIDKELGIK